MRGRLVRLLIVDRIVANVDEIRPGRSGRQEELAQVPALR
jgi:hypothetical protein